MPQREQTTFAPVQSPQSQLRQILQSHLGSSGNDTPITKETSQRNFSSHANLLGALKDDSTDVIPTIPTSSPTEHESLDQSSNVDKLQNSIVDNHDPLASLSGERQRKKINKCPHTDRKHYAKNMCHNCYHRKGKSKMAYACPHTNKSHYSAGMCQNCYLAKYYLKRK
jgi:hypothetical protein